MNNPLFNQLNKDNTVQGSDNQLIYNKNQTNNDNNKLKSPVSDSLLYNNMKPASDLFSNSSKEPEFSITNDNTDVTQNLLNSFQTDFRPSINSPLSQNVLNANMQQNQMSNQQTINNQNLPFSMTPTPPPSQMGTNIAQENIFDTLANNNYNNNNSNINNNWPNYLTNQQQTQQSVNNYNTNITNNYNNYDYNANSGGNLISSNNINNQMNNSNFPNFYSSISTNQNTFSPTVPNKVNLLQDYNQQQNNTYQTPINDPLQMNMQNINQQKPEQLNSMTYKQSTNYNSNFADPEMFKSLPSLNINQYNNNNKNNNFFSNSMNNNNTTNNSIMNDPLNVNIINTNTPNINNSMKNSINVGNMPISGVNQSNSGNTVKPENKNSYNLYNKNSDNSMIIQQEMERKSSGIMEKSSSNVNESQLSVKANSFQTVNSNEFNSPGMNSIISVETDKASLLSPFPEIKPSSITWEKLFASLELPPSFINCQTPALPESPKLSLENWVDPDIFFIIPNSDSLLDYLKKYFPKDTVFNRGLPKAEENDKYPEGTSILIVSQSWHALAVLTKKQILSTPPTKVETLMRLWYCHILALSKLGLIQIARAEIQKLGDFENDPKYQFESYPDLFPGLYGTFISFEIRVLKVLLLSQLDDTKQSLNGIYSLLHETKKRIILLEKNIALDNNNINAMWLQTWKSREIQLQLIIGSLLIKMKNIPSAIKVLKKIQKRYPKHPEILSAIGRLYIQIGNHDEAKKYFKHVENLIKDLKKSISNYNQHNTPLSLNANTINVKQLHEIILMNRSYISIMDNLYDLATQSLLEVLSLNPTHLVAANNLALCYLYQGQLKKAIETMESMISNGPALACSQESFIFNLSTMYDLTSNTFLHKKKFCLDRIVKYSKDGLNVSCLKLN